MNSCQKFRRLPILSPLESLSISVYILKKDYFVLRRGKITTEDTAICAVLFYLTILLHWLSVLIQGCSTESFIPNLGYWCGLSLLVLEIMIMGSVGFFKSCWELLKAGCNFPTFEIQLSDFNVIYIQKR